MQKIMFLIKHASNLTIPINARISSCSILLRHCKSLEIKIIPIKTYATSSVKDKENPSEYKIYEGPLTKQIKAVKVFSLTSSAAGLLCQPIIYKEAANIGSTSLLIAMCSVIGFFTFVTPLLLHFITKKYVTQVKYDSVTDTYTATTISFFLTPKQHKFKTEDVVVPEIPGMFTTFHAKNMPLFVEARFFNDPSHYVRMMGYDKPLDFKLGDTEEGKPK